jgi:hypothetical protein
VGNSVLLPFLCQYDVFTDLFECATDTKVAGGSAFSYEKHYLATLDEAEREEEETTKVELLASMMVSERVLRGCDGAIALAAGELPDKYAPALLEKAAEMATKELQSKDACALAYTVHRPTDLPEAERATGKKAEKGQAGTASRLDHPCQAFGAMPLDERKRSDAAIAQVQGRILEGKTVNFFELLAEKTEFGHMLRGDILAMRAQQPYTGPFPPTNETQVQAREAAISAAMSEIGEQ